MKIVILDAYCVNPGDLSWEALRRFGELEVYDRTEYDDAVIAGRIGDADIVITNKTPVSAAVLNACGNIKFIAVLATGYNIVDIACADEKGIPVSNIPGYGTAAVAQFVFALLLEICHHAAHHSEAVHGGRWESDPDWCFWDYPLIELDGKTMGVLGYGRIGRQTARIAKAMGMNVLANSRSKQSGGDELAKFVTTDELLESSDVIALHCPLLPETEGMINKDSIAKMKQGVIIINNSRGQLINEQDLADALNSGRVYAAGLDVVSCEPIRPDNPLLAAKNCFITPHISWAPKEARERIIKATEENVDAFLSGAPVNVVNMKG